MASFCVEKFGWAFEKKSKGWYWRTYSAVCNLVNFDIQAGFKLNNNLKRGLLQRPLFVEQNWFKQLVVFFEYRYQFVKFCIVLIWTSTGILILSLYCHCLLCETIILNGIFFQYKDGITRGVPSFRRCDPLKYLMPAILQRYHPVPGSKNILVHAGSTLQNLCNNWSAYYPNLYNILSVVSRVFISFSYWYIAVGKSIIWWIVSRELAQIAVVMIKSWRFLSILFTAIGESFEKAEVCVRGYKHGPMQQRSV